MRTQETAETSTAYATTNAMVPQGNSGAKRGGRSGQAAGWRMRKRPQDRQSETSFQRCPGSAVPRDEEQGHRCRDGGRARFLHGGHAALPERCQGKAEGATRMSRWPPGSRVPRVARRSHPTLATETPSLLPLAEAGRAGRRDRTTQVNSLGKVPSGFGAGGPDRGNGGRQQCRPLFAFPKATLWQADRSARSRDPDDFGTFGMLATATKVARADAQWPSTTPP